VLTRADHNLLLYYLDDILVLETMAEATMLRIVSRTGSPYKHILHILEQTSMDMIAEVLNCTTTSVLMAQEAGVSQPVSPVP
jgi:hypothetical protein